MTARTYPSWWLAIASLALLCLSACYSNPFHDDSIARGTETTASEQGVLASGHEPKLRHRDLPRATAPCAVGQVQHYPLWWEDSFEDKGDGDNLFAWTYADYVAGPAVYARWLLNTVGWPVSAGVTPPGTPMVSDGRIGQFHDAAPGRSPNPTADAADFNPDAIVSP
ncbi:MAG TPA: hypothetical protein VLM89_12300 [Phycisphaerae bacterium]|nr:hypothetical protein [Phycisphaerae bacterium]